MPKIELILTGEIDDQIKSSLIVDKTIKITVPDLSVTALRLKAKKGWELYLNCKNSNGDVAPLSTSYLQGNHLIGTSLKIYDDKKDKTEYNALMREKLTKSQKVLFGEIVLLDTEALMNKSAISERFNAKMKKREKDMQDEIKEIQKREEEKQEREKRINDSEKMRLRQQISKYEEDLLVLPSMIKEEVTRIFTNSIFTNIESDPTTSNELRVKLSEFRKKTEEYVRNKQKELEEEFDNNKDLELKEKEKEIAEKEQELALKEIALNQREKEISISEES
jgi:hypothetical protein